MEDFETINYDFSRPKISLKNRLNFVRYGRQLTAVEYVQINVVLNATT